MHRPIVVGVTGASGAVYAQRLLEVLAALGRDVHLSISPSACVVIREELGLRVSLESFDPAALQLDIQTAPGVERPGRITYHHHQDYMAPIASGSYLTGGMVICPCSGGTLSGVVNAASGNLIQRAADVHLKERRKLILVPRETPLSIVQLDNMRRAVEAGAVMLPAMPGWYHGVRSPRDLVDFIVARILDQLDIEHQLMKRWGSAESAGKS